VSYVLSFSGTEIMVAVATSAWKFFVVLAVVLLPFGQTHVRCQHQEPDMFSLVPSLTRCDGRCANHFTVRVYYNFAWSLYALYLGVWVYCALLVSWGIFMVAWCILLWAFVLVALLLGSLAAVCGLAEGHDINCDLRCEGHGHSCCFSCLDCGSGPVDDIALEAWGNDIFYFGPYPDGSSNECKRCSLCWPMAWLFLRFPMYPPNLWGGVFGMMIGTHPASWRPHRGEVAWIERLSFRTSQHDFRNVRGWRERVYSFLTSEEAWLRSVPAHTPQQNEAPNTQRLTQSFPGVHIIDIEKPFSKEDKRIVASSFEDYVRNECWICQRASVARWDLWLQCGHMFCESCSSEMLRRDMPCALCRTVSSVIARGPSVDRYEPPDIT